MRSLSKILGRQDHTGDGVRFQAGDMLFGMGNQLVGQYLFLFRPASFSQLIRRNGIDRDSMFPD